MNQTDDQLSLLPFVDVPEPQAPKAIAWPDGLPQPGIYHDVPFGTYAKWPAVNAHALMIGADITPLHMKAYLDGVYSGDTKDRKFGRAIHAALLEPVTFSERFPVAATCCELLKSGDRKGKPCGAETTYRDAAGKWYCGTHAKAHEQAAEPADYISGEEAGRITIIRKSVFGHKIVRMLRKHGGCEVSLVANYEGFPAKARIDKLIIDAGCPDTILDLKKCRPGKATEECLQRDIREYGYDVQAFMYVALLKSLRPDKKAPLYAWLFMEDGPPFDVRPIWASKPMIEVGRIKVNRAFARYKDCMTSGYWPGYADDIHDIYPADWEMKHYGLQ